MSNTEIKLEQNRKDQQVLKKEEAKLLQQIEEEKKPKWKFGDVAQCCGDKRYLLFDNTGRLRWFGENGHNPFLASVRKYEYDFLADNNYYKKITNIFVGD